MPTSQPTKTPPRVLIASGDADLRAFWRDALSSAALPEIELLEATHRGEVLDAAAGDSVQCLVVDHRLGDVSGLEVLDQIGADPTSRVSAVVYVNHRGGVGADPAALRQRGVFHCLAAEGLDPTALVVAVSGALEIARLRVELESFAHMLGHQLQNPLSSIAMFLSVLRGSRQRLEPEFADYIDKAAEASSRMSSLIRDLVDFVDAGTARRLPQRVDAAEVLRDVLASRSDEERARVQVAELPFVRVDLAALRKVWAALVDNAMRYRRDEAPCVRVSCRRLGDLWELRVADNGIGIQQAERQHVFEPLVRLHGHDLIPGSGMGLATAKRIVERYGGEIGLESEPGRGTEVWFTLPACADESLA